MRLLRPALMDLPVSQEGDNRAAVHILDRKPSGPFRRKEHITFYGNQLPILRIGMSRG